jgi:hypothetical protein
MYYLTGEVLREVAQAKYLGINISKNSPGRHTSAALLLKPPLKCPSFDVISGTSHPY